MKDKPKKETFVEYPGKKDSWMLTPRYPSKRKPKEIEMKCKHNKHRYSIWTVADSLDWLKECPRHYQQAIDNEVPKEVADFFKDASE